MAERTSALARGLPRPVGRRQLHDAAGAGQVSHARFGPAGERQRPDRVHRPDRRAPRPHRPGGSPPPTRSRREARCCSATRPTTTRAFWCATPRDASTRSRRSAPTCRARSSTGPATTCWPAPATRDRSPRAKGSAAGGAADAAPAAHRDRAARRRSRGDWASRCSVETRQQGSILFSAVLVLIALLVVIQLWLVAAALEALVARQIVVLVPTAIASGVLFVLSGGLLWYVVSFDARLRQWGPRVADRSAPGRRSSSTPSEVTREPGRTTPDHPPADALFRAPDLGPVHVPERLRHDRAPGGGRDGVAHAVRVSVARPDRVPASSSRRARRPRVLATRSTGTRSASCADTAPLWLFGLQHAPPAMATGVSAGASALRRCRWRRPGRS